MPRIYLTHFDACAQERFYVQPHIVPILQQEKGILHLSWLKSSTQLLRLVKPLIKPYKKVLWLEFWVAQVTKMFKVKHRKT